MSGDYSRDTFDALRDYAGVFLQQGRAALDADWNEMVAIFERRMRAATVDTIGRAVVPLETPLGFQIQLSAGPALAIGRGRFYLDGMLLECHGDFDATTAVFDRGREDAEGLTPEGVLDELISPETGDFVPYDNQPYWPAPMPEPLPRADGPHLAYVVAWQREVTALEAPRLLEPALGGLDTTTRWQTAWQVRVLPTVGAGATCQTPDEQLTGWQAEIAPSTARLTTRTVEIDDPEDPCLVPPTDGYTGIENQLYRVELHSVGQNQTDARFKFSRENASVVASIESFASPADRITVQRIGRDEILRFRAGDWVEVTDDRRELHHRSGQMLRVSVVHEETREIVLEDTVAADLVPSGVGDDIPVNRRSRLIRWDQRGIVRDTDGNPWTDLDALASDGLVPVPPPGTVLVLESGITVAFSTAAQAHGGFREMDYWRFYARTAGTQIQELTQAPPDGIQRHYAKLAIVTFPNSRQDCRTFWPPTFEGEAECCGCTVCVTAESHNSGTLTIQAAIDSVPIQGGTVCLAGGVYLLQEPLTISGRASIKVEGQGALTLLNYQGAGGAVRITRSIDIQLERFSLIARSVASNAGGEAPDVAGVTSLHSALVTLRRLAVLAGGEGDIRRDSAIRLDGLAIATKIEECLALAPIAIGSAINDPPAGTTAPQSFLALAELRMTDNILFGARDGIRLAGLAVNAAGAVIERNLILGGESAANIAWFEAPTGSTAIAANTAVAGQTALVLGVTDLRLQDNDISAGGEGDGVVLASNFAPLFPGDAQIIGNRIGNLGGAGLRIGSNLRSLMVKRNVIRNCGQAAIAATGKQDVAYAAIDNNVMEDVAAGTQQSAAAVVLTRVREGLVAGNRVQGVGEGSPPALTFAGIAAYGVGAISLEQNHIGAIGPDSAASPAIGIWARQPYFQVSARGNRISGAIGENPSLNRTLAWTGIQVGDVPMNSASASSFENLTPASVPGLAEDDLLFSTVGGQVWALTAESLAAIGTERERQITISGNQLYHAGETNRALVFVQDLFLSTVAFTDNQCRLQAAGATSAIVSINAPRIMASNNAVRRNSDQDAMHLTVGEAGAATVVGNITYGNIRVFPGGLNPPFEALNLVSS